MGDYAARGARTASDRDHRHACRHGPPLSRPIVGDVIGFALQWGGQAHGVLWISGDTVLYDGVRQVADRLQVGTALLHLGGVRFPISGPVRYAMTAKEAVQLCRLVQPRTLVPIHSEGGKHFREGRQAIERRLANAPEGTGADPVVADRRRDQARWRSNL